MIKVEISLRYNEDEGYYSDIDNAIEALLDIKQLNKEKEKM